MDHPFLSAASIRPQGQLPILRITSDAQNRDRSVESRLNLGSNRCRVQVIALSQDDSGAGSAHAYMLTLYIFVLFPTLDFAVLFLSTSGLTRGVDGLIVGENGLVVGEIRPVTLSLCAASF